MTAAGRCGILTGGTWCADHNKVVEFWPGENGIAEILGEVIRGGGSACNLAIDIRRLDPAIPVATIGLVGDDEDGRILIAEADAFGIDRSGLRILPGLRTNYTDAYTSARTGRRTHLFQPGVSAELCPDHFDFAATPARFLHLGLPGIHRRMDASWGDDANGWVCVLRRARAAGIVTNLELCSIAPERISAIVRPCLPHLDLLIVNDFEIAAIAGDPVGPGADVDVARITRAAETVMATGAMRLLVAHFPAGAVVVERGATARVTASVAVPADQVRGANGAGDAFAAGVLCGLHQGLATDAAVRLGHAAAAVSLGSLGTTDGVLPAADCLARAAAWGWRAAG